MVPNVEVNCYLVMATFLTAKNQMIQRCYKLLLSQSLQIYKATSRNEEKRSAKNVRSYDYSANNVLNRYNC